jgi:hypothetical protein
MKALNFNIRPTPHRLEDLPSHSVARAGEAINMPTIDAMSDVFMIQIGE